MNIQQRSPSFSSAPPAYGQYTLDRWKFLSPVANGLVAQTNGGPTGSAKYMTVKNGSAGNQTAIIQIVEQQNSLPMIGSVASLSFQARTGAVAISNLRAALLGWTGTADGTASATIISTWNSNGTNPIWGTNFTMLNTPSNLPLSSNWQTFKIENIAIPVNVNNVAVVIWADDLPSVSNAEWDLTQVQLEHGSVATSFECRPNALEMILAQRYYQVFGTYGIVGFCESATTIRTGITYPTLMRIIPNISFSGQFSFQCGKTGGGVNTFTSSTTDTTQLGVSSNSLYGGIPGFTIANESLGFPGVCNGSNIMASAEI